MEYSLEGMGTVDTLVICSHAVAILATAVPISAIIICVAVESKKRLHGKERIKF